MVWRRAEESLAESFMLAYAASFGRGARVAERFPTFFDLIPRLIGLGHKRARSGNLQKVFVTGHARELRSSPDRASPEFFVARALHRIDEGRL